MKKWILLLLGLAVLIAVLVFRERYENYEEALKAAGQQSGYIIPKCAEGYTINEDYTECKKEGSADTVSPTCPDNAAYTIREGQGVCEPSPMTTVSSALTPSDTPICPEGYSIDPSGKCMRVTDPVDGACQAGTLTNGKCYESAEAACPVGKKVEGEKCVDAPTNTTGGSAGVITSVPAPVEPSGVGKNVFGPAFTGLGVGGPSSGGDSTKTTQYPTLYGGFPESVKTKPIDKLNLPTGKSLGTEPGSEFLPYSREPGDMDLVPNPFKVSSTYAGREASEPVPFLTDFSAFFR